MSWPVRSGPSGYSVVRIAHGDHHSWIWEWASTILTPIVPCGSIDEKGQGREPKLAFTPRSVSFALLLFEKCRSMSCSWKDTQPSVTFTPTRFRNGRMPLKKNSRIEPLFTYTIRLGPINIAKGTLKIGEDGLEYDSRPILFHWHCPLRLSLHPP